MIKILLKSTVTISGRWELTKFNSEVYVSFFYHVDEKYIHTISFSEYNDFAPRWVNTNDRSDIIVLVDHIPTAIEMLTALKKTDNTACIGIVNRVLAGEVTIEQELDKNHGSFITAVLKGDFETALHKADSCNKKCLITFLIS